jgi:hypothetical protein
MMRTAVPVFLAALAVAAVPTASARDSRSQDTLQLNGVFTATFQTATCPTGTPVTTFCSLWTGAGVVPGLGRAQESYELFLDTADGGCWHASWQWTLTVVGKGEIDAAMQIPSCASQNSPDNVPATFTITGGSSSYAGATGSGTLARKVHETLTRPGTGTAIDTWQGTLSVPGLSFDTTPPTISRARNLHAKTKTKRGARVTYRLPTANDPTDGNLPVTCRPASGSRFRIGRTRVHCRASDNDGNSASTSFTITLTRVHRR